MPTTKQKDSVVLAFGKRLRNREIMPYDEFIRNQVAADLVGDPQDRHDRLAALGFFAMGPVYYQDKCHLERVQKHF